MCFKRLRKRCGINGNKQLLSSARYSFRTSQRMTHRRLGRPKCDALCFGTVLPTFRKICVEKTQLDAIFILNLFRQSTSTRFGHICSPSSGGILYIYFTIGMCRALYLTVCWPGCVEMQGSKKRKIFGVCCFRLLQDGEPEDCSTGLATLSCTTWLARSHGGRC